MCRYHILLVILATSTSLAGCGRREITTAFEDKRLTVAGSQDDVERFAKLQGSRRPALTISTIKPLSNGRVEATVTLPASYDGEDLIHTMREALAADLEYRFQAS